MLWLSPEGSGSTEEGSALGWEWALEWRAPHSCCSCCLLLHLRQQVHLKMTLRRTGAAQILQLFCIWEVPQPNCNVMQEGSRPSPPLLLLLVAPPPPLLLLFVIVPPTQLMWSLKRIFKISSLDGPTTALFTQH